MDVGVLAVRYAKALLGYARQMGVAEEIYGLCTSLTDIYAGTPSLARTLRDPLLSRQTKLDMLSSANPAQGAAKDVLDRYFSLLIDKKRESYLTSSLRSYMDLYRKEEGIAVVKIITAVPLEKEMEDKILSKVTAALDMKIELLKKVDPAIGGGFIFDINDYRLDASVAARLNRIRRQLLDKNRRIV